jgi:hypothetical protein
MRAKTRMTRVALAVGLATLAGSSPSFAQQATTGTATPAASVRGGDASIQGFSVVLVLGDLQGTAGSDDVPQAARKALTDMRDFLPYKSYKLLDASWVMCCTQLGRRIGPPGQAVRQTANVNQVLRGAEDQEYELQIRAHVLDDGRISVNFELTAAPGTPLEKLSGDARTPRMALHDKFRSIIDADFTMGVGETVVVGTSKMKGGTKALIALLTAVAPRTGATARE